MRKEGKKITDDAKALGLAGYKIGQERNEKCERKLFLVIFWYVYGFLMKEESGEGESCTQFWV